MELQQSSDVQSPALPPQSLNLNALAERWVCSIKQECLSKLILIGEGSLRRALTEHIDHSPLAFSKPTAVPRAQDNSLSRTTRWLVRIPGEGEKDSGVNAKTIPG